MASQESQPQASEPALDPLDEGGRFTLHRELSLQDVFTERETGLIESLRAFCRQGSGQVHADVLRALKQGFGSLGAMATALAAYPSLHERDELGGIVRSAETLMRNLLEMGEHGLEWTLPTKALLSRTFGIAKVHFWMSLRFALSNDDAEDSRALLRKVLDAIEEAVYTRLAEELYASFVTSRVMAPEVKMRAITQLMQLWDGRVGFTTHRFCPLLRSAWVARCRAPRVFGTLMGTSEIVSLLFQDCDARFVEWFGGRDMDSEEVQAFEEFVFDLPFEDLERVRQMMKEESRDAVGPDEVARYLGFGAGALRPLLEDPKALYSSFRNRRVKAQYRSSTRSPGPKRTAESYVLQGLLMADGGDEDDEGA